jgi:uncharacterized protein (TIGR03000 family)
MYSTLLCIASLCVVGQSSEKTMVYRTADPHGLLVVVRMRNGSPAPAGVQVNLTDERGRPIDSTLTDGSGRAVFSGLNAARHPVVRVLATKGELKSDGVEVRWRLFMDRELELQSATAPSDATRRPVYTATSPGLLRCEPSPYCSIPYRAVYECRQDPCGRQYGVARMVPECGCHCYVQDPCVPSTACDCAPQATSDVNSLMTGESRLTVSVPADAIVTINGKARKITGERRTYISQGLLYGYRYEYVVQAQIVRNGKTVEATQTVVLRAGESIEMVLNPSTDGTPEHVEAKR